jgi:transposase-like protein
MPRSVLEEPRFRVEAAAYAYVENIVWESGRFCPHCDVVGKSGPLKGKSTRIGTYKCYACRKPFTVKVGTIFEKSHVPMHIWLQAMHLICSSKKGFSANQFCRVLGVDFKTGWFIWHRIREAMKDDGSTGPLGGKAKIVEADETYFGTREGYKREPDQWRLTPEGWRNVADRRRNRGHKNIVVTLVERGGKARSVQAEDITLHTLNRIVTENAAKESALMTDELVSHETVNHGAEEYVRGRRI